MLDDENAGDEARGGLTRRQLVRAGAWAAPVIVLAAAVPATAASTTTVSVDRISAPKSDTVWTVAVRVSATAAGAGTLTLSSADTGIAITGENGSQVSPASYTVPISLTTGGPKQEFTFTVSIASADGVTRTITAAPAISGFTASPLTVTVLSGKKIPS